MRFGIVACAVLLAACGAPSPSTPISPAATAVEVSAAWAAPTPAGVDVSAGYLDIINETASDERLLSASSPRAARVEIHEMTMDGAVMRMRRIDGLDIPAGQRAQLAPGGAHLMFFGVTEPFVEGEEIPLVLTFDHAGDVDVALAVRRGS